MKSGPFLSRSTTSPTSDFLDVARVILAGIAGHGGQERLDRGMVLERLTADPAPLPLRSKTK